MSQFSRREFIKAAGGLTALGLAGLPLMGSGASKGRVLVIGVGYGGSIAARYLRMMDPSIEVTLIERGPRFVSCPLSNEVLSGERAVDSLTFGYDKLGAQGVKVVVDEVNEIDAAKKAVKTKGGTTYQYDRLIVSPGVDLRWGAIEGYDEAASQRMPHAWKAGPQTILLRKQLEAMDDGGLVVIAAPPNPYRCPPGPYERAAQIAYFLKKHKPKSRVVILDSKDAFAKQALFEQGWEKEYPGMIRWVSGANDGRVVRVEPKAGRVFTEFGEHQAAVANIIPPQKAATIAASAGLTDHSAWCPVDPLTFESKLHKDVHVIGDACIAGAMPKSGFSANSQAKVAAAAVHALLNDKPVGEPSFINTCYSLIAPDYGVSVAAVYQVQDGKIVSIKGAGGMSPLEASERDRKVEAAHALSWFKNITTEMFG
jgi:sulfide dehydrogenase [flavocytochrome c] flavoprotein subunit